MSRKVWTEVLLHPEALARLQAHADVVVGTQDSLAGAEAAIIGRSIVDAGVYRARRAEPQAGDPARHRL